MEMKIDSRKIRGLREARGWSQEHLAEVAGLSARTVQRIEADGKASPESRMALAAALEVEASELGVLVATTPTGTDADNPSPAPRRSWRRHLLIYLTVCGALLLFDVLAHGTVTWSKWPLLGWGIGVLLHRLRHSESAAISGRY